MNLIRVDDVRNVDDVQLLKLEPILCVYMFIFNLHDRDKLYDRKCKRSLYCCIPTLARRAELSYIIFK